MEATKMRILKTIKVFKTSVSTLYLCEVKNTSIVGSNIGEVVLTEEDYNTLNNTAKTTKATEKLFVYCG